MLGVRGAPGGGVAAENWTIPEAGRPLLTRVFCRDALFGKRLLLVAMQILAAGGILAATFRVGEAQPAIENRRFAMAGENRKSHASFETEMLLSPKLIQHWWL